MTPLERARQFVANAPPSFKPDCTCTDCLLVLVARGVIEDAERYQAIAQENEFLRGLVHDLKEDKLGFSLADAREECARLVDGFAQCWGRTRIARAILEDAAKAIREMPERFLSKGI